MLIIQYIIRHCVQRQNLTRVVVPCKYFEPNLMFASKAGVSCGVTYGAPLFCVVLPFVLLTNTRLG
jgi:hypothetical protein